MFTLYNALRGVMRHKRRGIISCLLVFSALSAVISVLFIKSYYDNQIISANEEFSSKVRVIFRTDLQYNNNENNGVRYIDMRSRSLGWDYDEVMAYMSQYDHPYPFTREQFEAAAEADCVADWSLSYMTHGYRFDSTNTDHYQYMYDMGVSTDRVYTGISTTFNIAGGEMTDILAFLSDNSGKYRWRYGMIEGTKPSAGECVITQYTAKEFGKQVGDMFELYDAYGSPAASLKISGIMMIYAVESEYDHENDLVPLNDVKSLEFYRSLPDYGTPYDRLFPDREYIELQERREGNLFVTSSFLYLIHTDFDTAYELWGDEETDPDFVNRHHFNNFMATYDLTSPEEIESFEAHVRETVDSEYMDQFEVTPYNATIYKKTMYPSEMFEAVKEVVPYGMGFSLFVVLITVLVSIRERGYDIGVMYSQGISRRQIVLQYALENTILAGVSTLLSAAGGWPMLYLVRMERYYMMYEDFRYYVPPEWVLVFLATVCAAFLVSAGITTVYLLVNNPAKILRER